MTVLEHIYAIQNIINKGVKSDDSRISNELILHYMNISRILLLKRKLNKREFINPSNYQLFCVPLCEDYLANCCDYPVEADCKILRSRFKIPKAVSGRTGLYFKTMYLSGKEISNTTQTSFRYIKYSITKKCMVGWFFANDYLWIIGVPKNRLRAVQVQAMLEDPTSLSEISTCQENETCYDVSTEDYPIEGELIDPMYKMVLEYMGMSNRYPEDNVNNSKAVEVLNEKEE